MTRTLIALFALAATGLAFAATETREVDAFTVIKLSSHADVVLEHGDEHKLVISASDNILERLRTEVENGVLTIKVKDKFWNWSLFDDEDIDITITFVDLEGLHINGSGDVSSDQLATNELDIHIRGSGNIVIDQLFTERLSTDISGSGDIRIDALESAQTRTTIRGSGTFEASGRTTDHTAEIFGSGDVVTNDLVSEHTSIVINGSGDAKVHADDRLDAVIRGSGDIAYSGNPEVSEKIYGGGTVRAD